ncbi:MAG: glycosyltransferase [Casimicrobiaceae bacterium]
MRVLHVIPSLSRVHGGPSRAARMMERGLRDAGVAVSVATTDDDGAGRSARPLGRWIDEEGGTRIYFRRWTRFYQSAPGALPWLWRHVRDFDLVQVHALFSFMSIAGAAVAYARGVPFIIRPLGTLASWGLSARRPLLKRLSLGLIERPLLRAAAAVHCTSEAEANEVRALEPGARTCVIPLAVESAAVELRPAESTEPVVLFLSRLDPKKNLEAVLDAWPQVLAAHPGARLRVAGTGAPDYVGRLRAHCDALGVGESVDWLGHLEGAEKEAAFAGAWLFVLPSHAENFGIAVAEALARGLPCVLTPAVAIAADVQTAGAGVICDGTPQRLAATLIRVLADADQREAMARAALGLVRAQWSPEVMAERLLALYQAINYERAKHTPSAPI